MDMIDYLLFSYGGEIVAMLVTATFGILGAVAKKMVQKFLDDKTKKDIAKTVVKFVEQCYKNLHGEEKLKAALERASELLAEKGIKVSAKEMETLIEAAVGEFNEVFNKTE